MLQQVEDKFPDLLPKYISLQLTLFTTLPKQNKSASLPKGKKKLDR